MNTGPSLLHDETRKHNKCFVGCHELVVLGWRYCPPIPIQFLLLRTFVHLASNISYTAPVFGCTIRWAGVGTFGVTRRLSSSGSVALELQSLSSTNFLIAYACFEQVTLVTLMGDFFPCSSMFVVRARAIHNGEVNDFAEGAGEESTRSITLLEFVGDLSAIWFRGSAKMWKHNTLNWRNKLFCPPTLSVPFHIKLFFEVRFCLHWMASLRGYHNTQSL